MVNGCFEVSGNGGVPAVGPASAQTNQFYNSDDFWSGFAGLSVQGVGCDESNDRVYVYVTKGAKKALDAISLNSEDIPVKVVNIGKTITRPESASSTIHRGNVFVKNNRIACGSSCQPTGEMYTGTFGAITTKDGSLFALSNNHVFSACNHIPKGQPIMSPSNMDCGPNIIAPREIARHSGLIELRSGAPEFVPTTSIDAAYAEITPEAVSSWQGGDDGYDTPASTTRLSVGMSVKKVGRTTGLTHGIVESVVPDYLSIPYQCKKFTATVWFQNIWMVKAVGDLFALCGDSGSLVVTEDGMTTVGLLFAATKKGDYGYVIPIDSILESLQMQLGRVDTMPLHSNGKFCIVRP